MTITQPHCLVNDYTVSPRKCNDDAPLYGATSTHRELTGTPADGNEAVEAAPARVSERREGEREEERGEGEREEERGEGERVEPAGEEEEEEEVRKPRVGRRPAQPTKAEIDEHYPLH